MIKSRKDLNLYLKEDAKRNGINCGWLRYRLKLICGHENAHIIHWMRHFRKCEYYTNNSGILNRILAKNHGILSRRIGLRLGISANINCIGYGLRIMHLCGGGNVECS